MDLNQNGYKLFIYLVGKGFFFFFLKNWKKLLWESCLFDPSYNDKINYAKNVELL